MTTDGGGAAKFAGYRRWLFAAGLVLSTISAIYLVRYALTHRVELRSTHIGPEGLLLSAVACALYAVGLLVVAIGWLAAVRACRDASPPSRVIGIALVSQIGKYVPGNVAQHIGKAVYGGSRGINLQVVAKSTLLEIASIAAAGAFVTAVGAASSPSFARLSPRIMDSVLSRWHLIVLVILIVASLSIIMLVSRVAVVRRALSFAPKAVAATFGLHVVSISLLGLSFYAVTTAFGGGLDARFCVALFAGAWLLGFVTPGAPAGLGVRETVLVLGLSSALGPMSLPAAILHRLVSAVADALAAGVGVLLLRADKGLLSAPPAPPAPGQAGS